MARVLVADDDEGIRSFLQEALELAGHQVAAVADGQQALSALAERGFDVLLTDLRMPRMDGLELLEKAQGQRPDLQVIVLTAHGSVETAVEAMKRGALDYLQKPISSPAELRLIVARAAERRALLNARERTALEDSGAPRLTWGAPAMEAAADALARAAATPVTVLILGESGSGKELAARAVHQWSPRRDGPFIEVNCAALADTLIESELFGHEKGAFTGAAARRRGRLELADGGSLFLDEVGELKLDFQAKLLRVIETQRFERLGGERPLSVDVRWIAATNRDLEAMVAEGRFREDLYHRLAVFPVQLPPLRERREDIPPLIEALLESIAAELNRPGLRLDDAARAAVLDAPWPGNIRQLRNTLERCAILSDGPVIGAEHLRPASPTTSAEPRTIAELERRAIVEALSAVGGHRKKAAARLGIGLRTLYEKIKRYQIG